MRTDTGRDAQSYWKAFTTHACAASLKALFDAQYGTLYTYGMRMTSDAGDIVKDAGQEVFLNLWKYKDNLDPETRVQPYLLKSVRNEILRIRSEVIMAARRFLDDRGFLCSDTPIARLTSPTVRPFASSTSA